MGAVVICAYKRTTTPFFVEQAGVNLYSLEELSCFLYHNIYLVDQRFFDDRLFRWMREEFGCGELAARLQNGFSSGSGFRKLALELTRLSGIFSGRELAALEERLKGLETLQEQERLKLRADELLNSRNERAAMEEYRRILSTHQNGRLGMEFYGAVWNNMGVCCARQFLFKEAADCFAVSYQYDPNEATKEQEELSRQLAEGILPGAGKKRGDFENPQKYLLEWEWEYRTGRGRQADNGW